jgi:pyrophosphatase PpaX
VRPSTHSITTLFFDWDGTLLDSAQPGFVAFQRALRDLGLSCSRESYENIYSPNWYAMYEALGLSREKWASADQLWLRHYGEEPPELVQGGHRTVAYLSQKGYRLGVVSSGTECRIKREIEALELSRVFEVVICNEHTFNKKPHPEGLELAMKLADSSTQTCCYIGDSQDDIHMGKQAGVLTIGVRSAYPGGERLLAAGPDIYLECIGDLLRYF